MKRARIAIVAVLLVVLLSAIVLWILVFRQFAEYPAVPWQSMDLFFEDEDGVAAVHCGAFRIAFEGHSFGTRKRSGDYLVDGRYPPRLFPGPEATDGDIGDGISVGYSQKQRLMTIRFHEHEIKYSHALKKLTVNDREYDTSNGQVVLLIKKDGSVQER